MKKSFVLLIVLLALSVGTVCMAQTELLKEKDQVNFTEKILYGDQSIVEGVTVEVKNYYSYQMYWDSVYTIGQVPDVHTEYQFYPWDVNEYAYEYPNAFGMIDYREDSFQEVYAKEDMAYLEGLGLAWRELYDQTGAGEEKTISIQLGDYLDYYTFGIDISASTGKDEIPFVLFLQESELRNDLKDYASNRNQVKKLEKQLSYLEKFQEFFKIPVIDGEVHKLALRKDDEGKVIGSASSCVTGGSGSGNIQIPEFPIESECDYFYFVTITAMSESDCYFTFNPYTYRGKLVDTSEIPGGYGIYHFPYDAEKGEIYPEELRMVYALDLQEEVYHMCMDYGEKNLFLFTIKNEQLYLSIIDLETMTLRDKMAIGNKEYGLSLWVYEGYVVLEAEELILLTMDENGNYIKQFSIADEKLYDRIESVAKENGVILFWEDSVFDWNGETLIFSGHLFSGFPVCGFYVAAVDTEGLQYCATYESSLMTAPSDEYARCRPVNKNPITIYFADTP